MYIHIYGCRMRTLNNITIYCGWVWIFGDIFTYFHHNIKYKNILKK